MENDALYTKKGNSVPLDNENSIQLEGQWNAIKVQRHKEYLHLKSTKRNNKSTGGSTVKKNNSDAQCLVDEVEKQCKSNQASTTKKIKSKDIKVSAKENEKINYSMNNNKDKRGNNGNQQRNGTSEVIPSRAIINDKISSKNERNRASDENKAPEMTENGFWPKNTVLITGDSMLTNINERTLSKNFNTKVRSFPGARFGDMFDYLKPLHRKKQGRVILVIGANDVQRSSAQTIISEIKALHNSFMNRFHVAML